MSDETKELREAFPLTASLVPFRCDQPGPPGVDGRALNAALEAENKLGAWVRWTAGGITRGPNGVYPWDVEDFLRGMANDD